MSGDKESVLWIWEIHSRRKKKVCDSLRHTDPFTQLTHPRFSASSHLLTIVSLAPLQRREYVENCKHLLSCFLFKQILFLFGLKILWKILCDHMSGSDQQHGSALVTSNMPRSSESEWIWKYNMNYHQMKKSSEILISFSVSPQLGLWPATKLDCARVLDAARSFFSSILTQESKK